MRQHKRFMIVPTRREHTREFSSSDRCFRKVVLLFSALREKETENISANVSGIYRRADVLCSAEYWDAMQNACTCVRCACATRYACTTIHTTRISSFSILFGPRAQNKAFPNYYPNNLFFCRIKSTCVSKYRLIFLRHLTFGVTCRNSLLVRYLRIINVFWSTRMYQGDNEELIRANDDLTGFMKNTSSDKSVRELAAASYSVINQYWSAYLLAN